MKFRLITVQWERRVVFKDVIFHRQIKKMYKKNQDQKRTQICMQQQVRQNNLPKNE